MTKFNRLLYFAPNTPTNILEMADVVANNKGANVVIEDEKIYVSEPIKLKVGA